MTRDEINEFARLLILRGGALRRFAVWLYQRPDASTLVWELGSALQFAALWPAFWRRSTEVWAEIDKGASR